MFGVEASLIDEKTGEKVQIKEKKRLFYLYPIKTKPKKRLFGTYDLETKDGRTQKAGFTRPFLCGMFDGEKFWGLKDLVPLRHKKKEKKGPLRLGEKRVWEEAHLEYRKGCIDKLCRRMFDKKYDGYIWYAHNGGTFDSLFILPWLTRNRHLGFEFRVIPVQSTIQSIQVTRNWRGRKYTWTLLDSMRLLPMSLARAAKTFGLEGKDDIDLNADESDPRWESYNERDCRALFEIMKKVTHLIEEVLGAEVGITAPATSMKLFRKRFQKERIPRHAHFPECEDPDCDGCCHLWIRKGYVGGRTEIFEFSSMVQAGEGLSVLDEGTVEKSGADWSKLEGKRIWFQTEDEESPLYGRSARVEKNMGKGRAKIALSEPHPDSAPFAPSNSEPYEVHEEIRYFDINSSYVAALCDSMPVGERVIHYGHIDWRMREQGFVGFAECRVEIPETCQIPPLPVKDSETKKLVFPAGIVPDPRGDKEYEVWDVDELRLLEDPFVNGKILDVGRVVWFGGKAVFKEMMETLWGLRDKKKEGYDEGLSMLAKLLGNGCYGKFAMALEREEIVFRRGRGSVWQCMICSEPLVDPELLRPDMPPPEEKLCESCLGSKPAGDDVDCDVWYRAKKVEPPYVIPQISAHVTSLARIRLWKFMKMVFELGGKLWMTDTDSIITNVKMPSSGELGALKDEYPGEPLRFRAVQPKVYLLEKEKPFKGEHETKCKKKNRCDGDPDKCKCGMCHGCAHHKVTFKGLPKSRRRKDIFEILVSGLETFYQRLEKVRGMARRSFDGPPQMVVVSRSIVSKYEKREVLPDGTTKPLVYPMKETFFERDAKEAIERMESTEERDSDMGEFGGEEAAE